MLSAATIFYFRALFDSADDVIGIDAADGNGFAQNRAGGVGCAIE